MIRFEAASFKDPALAYCLAAFVASAYPLSHVVGANMGIVPIPMSSVVSSLAGGFAFTVAVLLAARIVFRNGAGAAAWSCVFVLLFSAYHSAILLGHSFSLYLSFEHGTTAFVYTIASLVAATLLTTPWRVRRRDPVPALIVAVCFVGVTAGAGVRRGLMAGDRWEPTVRDMIASALSSEHFDPAPPTRDVFYIVLDGLGRADTLRDIYGVDPDPFVAFLKKRGFEVPGAARSNYAQTYLSLAATLNMSYLDDLVAAVGDDGMDRRALQYLIDHNALMALARRSGYRVIGVGSDYGATERLQAADVCICDRGGPNDIEQAVLLATPLSALPIGPWTYGAHRRKVLNAFEAVAVQRSDSERVFVFAHVIVPHPPFVFSADGAPRTPRWPFTFIDGSGYQGTRAEYVEGYRDQAQFVVQRLTALVEALLRRPGPQPVIVIHADHGPGSMLDWNDASKTNMTERLGIFAAYHFPDSGMQLEDTVTPVNIAMALATSYLGADLPQLPDRSYFSTWDRPYDMIPVAPGQTPIQPRPNDTSPPVGTPTPR